MDTSCPYCHKSLRWKVLAYSSTEGRTWIFRKPTVARCPYCGHVLVTNVHPKEQLLFNLAVAGFLSIIVAALICGTAVALVVAVASFLAIAGGAAYIHAKYLAGWSRYVQRAEG